MLWNDNGRLVGAFHAVTTEPRIPRGEPAAEEPAIARTSPRGHSEVDPWNARDGIEQRLQQAATDSAPL